ncbi:TPA: hypothetical protein ACT9LS_000981 [Legionella pneumophila]|nr:hypothetical protein [Legionella pneumophila]HAU0888887.1 hypothetical protein [Legionella pneumophila]HCD9491453.1 hypothetical protein [Legionella pneumophila]HCD9497293.1 hypothetical protein [Legionella pneumophila]HCD9517971.1 hypothetical protein [Legionella pneumophila]
MYSKSSNVSKHPIKIANNDCLLRHIMNYMYAYSVGKPTEAAFQRSELLGNGLSVSIERLLSNNILKFVIKDLEKGKHQFICNYKTMVQAVINIHCNGNNAFDINHTPTLLNPSHADIKFSNYIGSLTPLMQKKYRKELMDVFKP